MDPLMISFFDEGMRTFAEGYRQIDAAAESVVDAREAPLATPFGRLATFPPQYQESMIAQAAKTLHPFELSFFFW